MFVRLRILDGPLQLRGIHRVGGTSQCFILCGFMRCFVIFYIINGNSHTATLVAVANGISIYGNVVTRASHRGQGFGRAGMNAAIAWARDAGALAAGIQVAAGNTPAIKLYSSLGFAHAYDYHYRKPQPAK